MPAIPYKHYPLDPPDTPWDANAEIAKASTDDLRVMCAWDDATRPEQKNGYKLPHHHADTYHTNLKGVIAAGNALWVQGAEWRYRSMMWMPLKPTCKSITTSLAALHHGKAKLNGAGTKPKTPAAN